MYIYIPTSIVHIQTKREEDEEVEKFIKYGMDAHLQAFSLLAIAMKRP